METIVGYHFVSGTGASRMGNEKPFDVGEYRRLERPNDIALCSYGYHGVREPSHALIRAYIYGPLVERAEYDEPIKSDKEKFVSAGKRVLARVDVKIPLIFFAADCAERVLSFFENKHPDDMRVRKCIEGARAFARGEITHAELLKLRSAAYAANAANAAAYAANAATNAAAYAANAANAAAYAAYAAANAAAYAARKTERHWQRRQFNQIILNAFETNRP